MCHWKEVLFFMKVKEDGWKWGWKTGGLIQEQELLTKAGGEEETGESLAELLSSTDQDVVTHLE